MQGSHVQSSALPIVLLSEISLTLDEICNYYLSIDKMLQTETDVCKSTVASCRLIYGLDNFSI